MKKIVATALGSIFLLLTGLNIYAQSSNQNYIQIRTPQVPVTTVAALNALTYQQQQTTVQYFDGLGRPLQSVQKQAATNGKDIVQPFEYDAYGREVKKYLPYSNITGSQDGSYKTNALAAGQGVWAHYKLTTQSIDTTSFPFSEMMLEASPLNRMTEQGAPGKAFRVLKNATGSTLLGNTVKTEYGTNTATEVKLWTVTSNGATGITNYGANQLHKTTLKDENWKAADGVHGTVQEFKDKEGKVVLKRTFNKNPAGATETLSTYYVYDDFGNLRYVLPPAVTVSSFIETDAQFKDLMYGYHYDSRQRVMEKKLPGKDWEYIVYNKLDQVVYTQDGVQRLKTPNEEWSFTKYDALGRVILTGTMQANGTRDALQTYINGQTVLWESKGAVHYGYTNNTMPQITMKVLTANYYDDYNFSKPAGYTYVTDTLNTQSNMTHGLMTGSMVKVLGSTDSLWIVNYYDKEGRIIQQHSQNYVGGKEVINTKYSFVGQPLVTKRVHTNSKGIAAQTYLYWYQYDHMGRKTRVLHKVINGTINAAAQPVILADYAYNELGQLTAKKLHSIDRGTSYAQVLDYRYNIRGWLTKLNDPASISATSADKADKFGLELKYDNSSTPQYNGNIAGMVWRGTQFSAPMMEYGFSYDKLNRLLKAQSLQGGNYQERIDGYDLMGNILKLSRRSNNDLIDSLVYTYKVPNLSNQLDRVDEKSASTNKTQGFNEIGSIQQAGEYSYDVNGNMLTDKNAGITTNIVYNYLNLPQTVVKGTTTINYLYDATGRKLRKTVGTTIDDYVDGLQLQTVGSTTTIKFIATEEGRANWNGATSPYYYHYDLKDHLGNTRVTISEAGAVVQEDSYYAFGMQMPGKSFNANNKYLYNGKELQVETGWYDYGARFYDPVIARWNHIDPKAELYFHITPYAYATNTPVNAIDSDGRLVVFINGNHYGDGGGRQYWQASIPIYKTVVDYAPRGNGNFQRINHVRIGTQNLDFAGAVMDQLDDHKAIYRDGALGGWAPFNFNDNTGPATRQLSGYSQGMQDAAMIINSLEKTGGVITESIKIITHSMGGAYGKGYVRAILDYARKYNIQGVKIAFEADFAPFQPKDQKAVKDKNMGPILQFSHNDDSVAGNDPIDGATQKDTKSDAQQGHSIFGFLNQIKNLPAGKYKVVNGQIIPE